MDEKKKVCVIGLGYVGLPLACLASHHFEVYGLDIDQDKINKINNKISPLDDQYTRNLLQNSSFTATTNPQIISESEIIVVCVPTPIDDKHLPDLRPLKGAMETVTKYLKPNQLIIIESTIYPGTTEEIVVPILERSSLNSGTDFSVAYCPERIDPGNVKWVLENIPRVLGGLNIQDAERAKQFYNKFIHAEIKVLNSIRSAEAVKILENTFRDVNIAFINEMAKSFDNLGIDLVEVIDGAATKPFGFMPFYPGPGVGGHCIPVDPYYLIERAKMNGFDHQFLSLARKINLSMPKYVVDSVQDELNHLGKSLSGARIGILGYAYKKDVDDIRESPAIKVIEHLKKKKAHVSIYDPYVSSISTVDNLDSLFNNSDYLLVLTNHSQFQLIEPDKLKQHDIRLILDTRNCLDKKKFQKAGITCKGIGRI